jgi:Protein of unknown function (DUF3298)
MNHIRSVLVALAGAAVITGATGCGASSTPPPSASTVATSPSAVATTPPAQPVAAGAQSCAALGGTVGPDSICKVHTATDGYEIDFSFPADYPDQQAVTDYVTRERDEFIDFVAELPRRDWTYSLDAEATTYRSGTPTSGTVSVVFSRYSDTGAHPVTGYDTFTYDIGKAARITFDTLFKPGTNPVAVLDPIVRRQFEERFHDYGPVQDNTMGAEMYRNFAITDDAVIFFIGQGAWLPQVAGPRKVSVPRAELASILA